MSGGPTRTPLSSALYGDIDEREAAFEKFVWAADGNATEMMDRQGSIEEFEIVKLLL